jgi:chromosomal replication initiation ATPase DnaA
MFLIKQLTQKSLRDIALFFDSKSHATVKHAISSIEQEIKSDRVLSKQLQELQVNLSKRLHVQA